MATYETRDVVMQQERFIRQMVAHHRTGDHYPDPSVVARELCLSPAHAAAILDRLRAARLIAASPYDPERLRLTPRCWEALRRASQPAPHSARDAA